MVNVGKYTIHGSYGKGFRVTCLSSLVGLFCNSLLKIRYFILFAKKHWKNWARIWCQGYYMRNNSNAYGISISGTILKSYFNVCHLYQVFATEQGACSTTNTADFSRVQAVQRFIFRKIPKVSYENYLETKLLRYDPLTWDPCMAHILFPYI